MRSRETVWMGLCLAVAATSCADVVDTQVVIGRPGGLLSEPCLARVDGALRPFNVLRLEAYQLPATSSGADFACGACIAEECGPPVVRTCRCGPPSQGVTLVNIQNTAEGLRLMALQPSEEYCLRLTALELPLDTTRETFEDCDCDEVEPTEVLDEIHACGLTINPVRVGESEPAAEIRLLCRSDDSNLGVNCVRGELTGP